MATIERTTTPPEPTRVSKRAPIREAIDDLRANGQPGEAIVLTYQHANAATTSMTRIRKRYGGDDLKMYTSHGQLVIKLLGENGEVEAPKGRKGKKA